jgi:hypothetical protein
MLPLDNNINNSGMDDDNNEEDVRALLKMTNNANALRIAKFELAEGVRASLSHFVHLNCLSWSHPSRLRRVCICAYFFLLLRC